MDETRLLKMSRDDLKHCKKYISRELYWKTSATSLLAIASPFVSSGCFTSEQPLCGIGIISCGFLFFGLRQVFVRDWTKCVSRIDTAVTTLKQKKKH